MGIFVSIAKAKAAFASLIARAEKGEEVTVTRHGRPVARIVPITKQPPIKFGDLEGLVEYAGDYSLENLNLTDEEAAAIERDIVEDDELYRKGKPAKDE